MLFDVIVSSTVFASASIYALNILLNVIFVILVSFKSSFLVILNDPNISSSISIPVTSCLVLSILSV